MCASFLCEYKKENNNKKIKTQSTPIVLILCPVK